MPLDTPTTALDGTLFAQDPQVPTTDATEQALPLSDTARGVAPPDETPSGDSIPAQPEAPETPDFPRVDTSQREAPDVNQEARNREALAGLLGTLGTAFASAGDDPTLLNIGAGISQGATEQLGRRREEFKRRQQAYNEFLTQAQRFNREMQQRETQADYERRLSAFEQQSEARQGALDRRADRRQSQAEDERQHEQTLEEIRERGEQRRHTQRVENQNSGGGGGSEPIQMNDLSVPSDPVEAERRLNMVNARLEEMRKNESRFQYKDTEPAGKYGGDERLVTRTDEEYRERLSELEQYRRLLRDQVGQRDDRPSRSTPGPTRSGPAATQGSSVNPGEVPTRGGGQRRGGQRSGGQSSRRQWNRLQSSTGQQANRQQSQSEGGSYVDELNSTLQQNGRRSALEKIADDLEAGRLSQREAQAYYQQVAPDSLLNR